MSKFYRNSTKILVIFPLNSSKISLKTLFRAHQRFSNVYFLSVIYFGNRSRPYAEPKFFVIPARSGQFFSTS